MNSFDFKNEIVVTDASPIISLELIPNPSEFLHKLFYKLYIPEKAMEEAVRKTLKTYKQYLNELGIVDMLEIQKVNVDTSILGIENVNAIPLSDEWVVDKLGFEKLNFHFYFHPMLGGMFLRTPFLLADRYYLKTNMGDNVTVVRYVHQLQNIFFSITGEDICIKEVTV